MGYVPCNPGLEYHFHIENTLDLTTLYMHVAFQFTQNTKSYCQTVMMRYFKVLKTKQKKFYLQTKFLI